MIQIARFSLLSLVTCTALACSSGGSDDPGAGTTDAAAAGGATTGQDAAGGQPSSGGASGVDPVASGGVPGGTASGGVPGGGGVSTGGGAPGAGGQSEAATGGAPSSSESESAGCGMTVDAQTGTWVTHSAAGRDYDVHLPGSYDATRAYPVVLLLHGCGSPTNNIDMETVVGDDAIVVRGAATMSCWDESGLGDDVPYLDALMEDVQGRYCANTDHLFAVGYSSGSWLASALSCHRAEMYRGIATVAGGEQGDNRGCEGQVARIFVNDKSDTNNKIEWAEPGRTRIVSTNNCDDETMPFDPSPCVEHQGCDPGYPVVWCPTEGRGHDKQQEWTKETFWKFFQSVMTN